MPSPAFIFRLACLACLSLTTVARSINPWILPRDANTTSSTPESTNRKPSSPYSVSCSNVETQNGKVVGLLDGFHHLMTLDGKPGNDPDRCGRINCSHDTAITWCNNDKHNRKDLNSYQDIARAAMQILQVKTCWQYVESYNYMEARINGIVDVNGEDWSVVVAHGVC